MATTLYKRPTEFKIVIIMSSPSTDTVTLHADSSDDVNVNVKPTSGACAGEFHWQCVQTYKQKERHHQTANFPLINSHFSFHLFGMCVYFL